MSTWLLSLGQICIVVPAILLLVAVWALHRLRRDPETAETPEVPAEPSRPKLDNLSTLELCTALRRSYRMACWPGEVNEMTRAQVRGYVLDEIERRDPVGFSRWMATVPSPGSDPTEHLSPSQRLAPAGRTWWW
jgi:hypothetical protein